MLRNLVSNALKHCLTSKCLRNMLAIEMNSINSNSFNFISYDGDDQVTNDNSINYKLNQLDLHKNFCHVNHSNVISNLRFFFASVASKKFFRFHQNFNRRILNSSVSFLRA